MKGKSSGIGNRCAVILLLSVCMAGLCAGCGEETVRFQDPLVERCVRDALEKSVDDPISARELANVDELTIDCTKGIGLVYDHLSLCYDRGSYVNLADLKYLTGLTTLEINNDPKYDQLVNVDAIANCKNLERLRLDYGSATKRYNCEWECTEKELGRIVAGLPFLKEFSANHWIPEELQDWIRGSNEELEINCYWEADPGVRFINPYDDRCIFYTLTDLDKAPKDMEDLLLLCEGGETVDVTELRQFENLRTLTIYSSSVKYASGEDPIPEEGMCKIKNLDALKDLKAFYGLNVCGATGDFGGIGELTQLKELTIVMSKVNDASFVEKLGDLRELTFMINFSEDFSRHLKKAKLQNLNFLCANSYEVEDGKWLSGLRNLEALELGVAPKFFYSAGGDPSGSIIADLKTCAHLRYFRARGVMQEGDLDVSPLAGLKNLQYVLVRNASGEIKGIDGLIGKEGMRFLILEGKSRSNDNDVKWMELGAQNESLGKLVIGGMAYLSVKCSVLRKEQGEEAVRAFLKERQPAFQKCFENHLLCEGYDNLLHQYETVKEIESFINQ